MRLHALLQIELARLFFFIGACSCQRHHKAAHALSLFARLPPSSCPEANQHPLLSSSFVLCQAVACRSTAAQSVLWLQRYNAMENSLRSHRAMGNPQSRREDQFPPLFPYTVQRKMITAAAVTITNSKVMMTIFLQSRDLTRIPCSMMTRGSAVVE